MELQAQFMSYRLHLIHFWIHFWKVIIGCLINCTARRNIKKYILGAFRVLEVTHNLDLNSEFFNTFYPCLHCILMVDKGYFSKCYIS